MSITDTVQAGVFPIDKSLDADVVEKLAAGQVQPEEVGLGDRLFWFVEDEEDGERFAGVSILLKTVDKAKMLTTIAGYRSSTAH